MAVVAALNVVMVACGRPHSGGPLRSRPIRGGTA